MGNTTLRIGLSFQLSEKVAVEQLFSGRCDKELLIPPAGDQLCQQPVSARNVIQIRFDLVGLRLRGGGIFLAVAVVQPRVDDVQMIEYSICVRRTRSPFFSSVRLRVFRRKGP